LPLIKDLNRGDEAEGQFIVQKVAFKVTKTNSDYAVFELKDKSGEISALNWNPPKNILPDKVYRIKGTVTEYNNTLRVDVKEMTIEDSVDESRFVDTRGVDLSKLKQELFDSINKLTDQDYKNLVLEVMDNERTEKYVKYPAAKTNHHSEMTGLARHSLSVAQNVEMIGKKYRANINLLIAGALLHDIGKIYELDFDYKTEYTTKGLLLGHISIGYGIILEAGRKLKTPQRKLDHLLHLILSHHTKLEYGSPVIPLSKEAHVLAMADDLDFKMDLIDRGEPSVDGEFAQASYIPEFKKIYYDTSHTKNNSHYDQKKDLNSDKKNAPKDTEDSSWVDEIII
jgi:3'-5' exoribonuclease